MLHHLTQNNSQEPPLPLRAPCWKSNTNSGAIAEPHYWECNTSSSLFGNTLHWDLINVATSRWVQTGAFSLRPCLWAFLFYFVFVFLHTLSDFSKLMQRRDVAISVRPAILPNIKKKPFWSKETSAVQQLFPQGVSFHFLFPVCGCETCRNISLMPLMWWNCWWDSHIDLLVTRRSDHVINIRFRQQCVFKPGFLLLVLLFFPVMRC